MTAMDFLSGSWWRLYIRRHKRCRFRLRRCLWHNHYLLLPGRWNKIVPILRNWSWQQKHHLNQHWMTVMDYLSGSWWRLYIRRHRHCHCCQLPGLSQNHRRFPLDMWPMPDRSPGDIFGHSLQSQIQLHCLQPGGTVLQPFLCCHWSPGSIKARNRSGFRQRFLSAGIHPHPGWGYPARYRSELSQINLHRVLRPVHASGILLYPWRPDPPLDRALCTLLPQR